MMRMALLLGLAVALISAPARASGSRVSGTAEVIEGDLLLIDGRHVRLWGVDAPEPEQNCYGRDGVWPCGQAAIAHLRAFIGAREVQCAIQADAPDDVVHGKCRVMGLDLSAELANHGLALVPRDGPQDYILNHHDGRTHSAGVWGTIYVTPWEWRHGRRVVEWINDERGCAVKGDVSAGGDRVYYLPDQPEFQDVRIEVAKGERWFCSAEEAGAAGWRPFSR